MARYRIVRDYYAGYEVQQKGRFGFWKECKRPGMAVNTHKTIEDAEKFANEHAKGFVVKELGELP